MSTRGHAPSTNPAIRSTERRNMSKRYRIGQIVPSSNTTMETEIPSMLRAREAMQQR